MGGEGSKRVILCVSTGAALVLQLNRENVANGKSLKNRSQNRCFETVSDNMSPEMCWKMKFSFLQYYFAFTALRTSIL